MSCVLESALGRRACKFKLISASAFRSAECTNTTPANKREFLTHHQASLKHPLKRRHVSTRLEEQQWEARAARVSDSACFCRKAQHQLCQPLRSQIQQLDTAASYAGEVSPACTLTYIPLFNISFNELQPTARLPNSRPSSGGPASSPAAWISTST